MDDSLQVAWAFSSNHELEQAISGGIAFVCEVFGCAQKGLRWEVMPRNPDRRDYRTRMAVRVLSNKETLCHLTIGSNLSSLWRRTQAFHKASPTIACAPIFFKRTKQCDYLAVEFFPGETLEALVADGRMKASTAVEYAQIIIEALQATEKASSPEAVERELQVLFEQVQAAPIFGGLDQCFLQEAVFPLIRQGALRADLKTRWTNGDLVPRNVLVDRKGSVRLVDYEFAMRTHFFAFFNLAD